MMQAFKSANCNRQTAIRSPSLGACISCAAACAILTFAPPSGLVAQEDVAETAAKAVIDTTPIVEPPITQADREHWAFRPVKRPEVPAVKDQAWTRSSVDALVLAKFQGDG